MDTVKVSWSGGKDSTCALSLHLDRGDKVIGVCYIPMFTDTIPLLLKGHYEHILRTAAHFRELGAEIHKAFNDGEIQGQSIWISTIYNKYV